MSRAPAQLPYSRTDFHQIRHQPYLPDSGSGMSRAQLPYSPTNFNYIREQPYPLPTNFVNVPDFRLIKGDRSSFNKHNFL